MKQTIYFMGVNFNKEETVYHPLEAEMRKDGFYVCEPFITLNRELFNPVSRVISKFLTSDMLDCIICKDGVYGMFSQQEIDQEDFKKKVSETINAEIFELQEQVNEKINKLEATDKWIQDTEFVEP